MSELRRHPFLDTWVITATHRQERTFEPPPDYCPLCPTQPGGFPTEIPFSTYDVVVFENKFPSLSLRPPQPAVAGTELMPVRPSSGVCEVICYTQAHEGSFASLPFSQARKLARVWKDRYVDLSARADIDYIFIFENKGKEIGVTLAHPHGQIYAYPYLPSTAQIELEAEKRHLDETGRLLMADVLAEHQDQIFFQNGTFVAFIPKFARYPYETYVTPKRHIASLAEMEPAELDDLAEALLVVAKKFDGLFGFSMPYIMGMHQAPTTPGYEFNWFHVEFYPPYRTANKLKYLAGSEAGMNAFINDTLPEVTAETMRGIAYAPVR